MSSKGAKPGERRGGRAKGVKNKATQSVIERLKDLNCDPIEGMAKIAKQAMEEGEMQLAGNMYKELAQYVAPKRKSVEVDVTTNGESINSWTVNPVTTKKDG